MTKYTWIRAPVDIYSRDRKGGHDAPVVADGMGYRDQATAKTARKLKKQTRRKQRRQAAKIKAEALAVMEADYAEDMRELIELEASWYDFDSISLAEDFGFYDDIDDDSMSDYWGEFGDYER